MHKLVLVGDSCVGKSCIISRFCDASKIASMPDIKMKEIELGGKKIYLQIWDTNGGERFRALIPSFCRGATGIMFVYDITNEGTFDSVSTWLEYLDEHVSENYVRMLLGNKCELEDQRAVSRERAEMFANDHSMVFLEASAESNINIDKAFRELAVAILERQSNDPHTLEKVEIGASGRKSLFGCCTL